MIKRVQFLTDVCVAAFVIADFTASVVLFFLFFRKCCWAKQQQKTHLTIYHCWTRPLTNSMFTLSFTLYCLIVLKFNRMLISVKSFVIKNTKKNLMKYSSANRAIFAFKQRSQKFEYLNSLCVCTCEFGAHWISTRTQFNAATSEIM